MKIRAICFLIVPLIFLTKHSSITSARQAKCPFTVADEIGLTIFNDPNGRPAEIHLSPDGNYLAVWSERGRLDLDCPEDSLRFYRSHDIRKFLEHSVESESPSLIWVVNLCKNKEGRTISDWRWLTDSTGVAFLERASEDQQHLVLADLQKKTVEPLTSTTEIVQNFDVVDRQHYVYSASRSIKDEQRKADHQQSAVVGTGRSLSELILPSDRVTTSQVHLWAVMDGKRFQVKVGRFMGTDSKNGSSLTDFRSFALSPDGKSLVTTLPVADVPSSWETLYPPPYPSDSHRIHAGHNTASQYIQLNLQTGSAQSLTEAPMSDDAGWWWGGTGPSWSSDGREILLPGTFVKPVNRSVVTSGKDDVSSRPCVAVVNIATKTSTCVEILKVRTDTTIEDGYHTILGAQFVDGDSHRIRVNFFNRADESMDATEYRYVVDGSWEVSAQIKGIGKTEHNGLEVMVKQGLNDPPQRVASSTKVSRVIWDPNPQLKRCEWGEATVYKWKDKEGREWRGGLYKPVDYKHGQLYPLVIQTHGFVES